MSARGRLTVVFATALASLGVAFFVLREGPPAHNGQTELESPDAPVEDLTGGQVSVTNLSDNLLRSALEELCADEASSAGNPLPDPRLTAVAMGSFDEWRQRLLEQLSVSPESEHLVLAALLDRESTNRMNLVERAVASNPQDALALWVAVNVCADQYAPSGCPRPDWERQLLSIDGQNSESWISVAANRYQRGDVDGALEALQHAATSAESRAFWVETIEMAERGLAVAGDLAFPERAAMAFGVAATSLPRIDNYIKMCRAQAAADVSWAYACLAYGQVLEAQGKTDMGQSIALALQMLALEALGDREEFARVERRKQQRANERSQAYSESLGRADELMISSPALFASYLAAIRTQGEWGARTSIIEEIERLMQDRPELECMLEG